MSLEKMKTLTEKVHWILSLYPDTRDDDKLLIYKIYKEYYNIRQETFLEVIRRDDLPSFESIRRFRQKIQEECEWLRGTKRTQKRRLEAQEAYIDFSQIKDLTAFMTEVSI